MTTLSLAFVATPASAASAEVDKQVLDELASNGTAKFMVYLKEKANLSGAAGITAKTAKTQHVYQQLTSTAARTQADLSTLLKKYNAPYQSFWISNLMVVSGDKTIVDAVAARPEVKKITAVGSTPMLQPTPAADGPSTMSVEWGVANINAPRVWNDLGIRGEGVVVGSIDGGVDYDHPALVGKYRGNLGGGQFDHNYNWWDPSQVCGNPSLAPCTDPDSHGTHTMGTMVGDDGAGNQIGVAPGAKWIAARGCEARGCSDTALLSSGQWMTAPTDLNGNNPRPELRPDIINNSWGADVHDDFYADIVDAWVNAGIMPVFASGNAGPSCGTAGSPGDYENVYSVGGYDINNNIYVSSSRGSGTQLKPNISAPAVNVRSSINNGAYTSYSGTSMATPHVAGTIALMWSAAPELKNNIAATRQILDDTARDVNSLNCGGTVDDNNNFGEGRLDAFTAVLKAQGKSGSVVGTVTDATSGAPIASATVVSGDASAITGVDGKYSLIVTPGEITVTASKYGYATKSTTVDVAVGAEVTANFALPKKPSVTVSGRVLDGSGHGWGLYAKLTVANAPIGTIFTNPATGAYSFSVPADTTYDVTAVAVYPGYSARTVQVVVGTAPVTQDIALEINASTCNAPGYSQRTFVSENFDAETVPTGWSVVKRNPTGAQWEFNDPGGDGNKTGGSGRFADADSDEAGFGTTTDTDLVTPTMNLTGVASPLLTFNSDFNDLGAEDFTDVDVSIDGGTTWTNVYHQIDSRRGPKVESVPLTPAANQADVKVRFHYFGTFDWWWQVDNVRIFSNVCEAVPGGLVVGFTTDGVTGAPLNDVTVTSDDRPAEKAVSGATPDDPNIPDGFYYLFSSLTGAHPFTASKLLYTSVTKPVTVTANSVVKADFALGSARITVTPAAIESYQTLGQTRTFNITVRNTGSTAAEVELFERSPGFQLLGGQQGAALQQIRVPGGVSPAKWNSRKPRGITKSANQPWAADAWTPIADQPVTATDQAAAWLGGKLYVVGGVTDSAALTDVYAYDPLSDAWATLPDMPTGRQKAQAAQLDGKLYVFGGWDDDGTPVASVDVFNPADNEWNTLAATNPSPVAAAGVAVVKGKVLIVGGCVDGDCATTADSVVFDPLTGGFSEVAPYPHSLAWHACGAIGSKAYCAGGFDGNTTSTDAFAYDVAANTWTPIAAMPEDRWAASGASAGGLLVLSAGVTAGASTITNKTIAYDPVTNTWQGLPNANVATYRGAGACGFYKVGGLDNSNDVSASAEHLGDLGDCITESQVPWLSEDPQTFTLAPGASRTVKVTLAATTAAGVDQPGDYTAQIVARLTSPHPVTPVSVTMHVLPPANWGKISGTVTGEGCSGAVPLQAQIEIGLSSNPDIAYPVRTRRDGTYAIWLPKGRYDVIVSKDGWRSQVKRHQVQAGFAEVLDFSLKPFQACAARSSGV